MHNSVWIPWGGVLIFSSILLSTLPILGKILYTAMSDMRQYVTS